MKKNIITIFAVLFCAAILSPWAGGEAFAADVGKLRVALVVNQRFGDNGPMDDMSKGADRAAADFGVEVKKLESSSAANFEEDVRAMSRAGYDLIITTFPYMSDSTKLVAAEYPKTMYSAIFQFINVGGVSIPNVWDTEFHGEGAFYLAGYLAGRATKTNRVGLVIGAEEPTPNAEGNAFMRGAKDANPGVTVDFAFVGSYEDPAKAKEITSAMIAGGCDFVQANAGASGAGVVEAAKDAGVLCASEITDYYDGYRGFVGIVGIGFGETVYASIKQLADGQFPGGSHGIRGLANGGYFMDWPSYERFAAGDEKYGPALKSAIEEAKNIEKQIVEGGREIAFDTEVPNWGRISKEG
ncbi:MAG: BMP family ABC transporter substrate-binding protein [Synergistaceae bacterium]|jgi:basic membrane protein A|nr:BMP family ABC transporter substrate-binding protein [Synergistaceae bacterium]